MSFLTEKEITKQLHDDQERWNNTIYDGEMPKSFMEHFKKAVMSVPPAVHKYNMQKVKEMVSKRYNEVTNLEVGMMINLIYHSPFKDLYETLEEGIRITMEFDKIRDEYNQKTAAIESTLIKKRDRLYRLAGLGGNVHTMQAEA